MKKLIEWLDDEETQHIHPVERAARAHYRLMAIFPWPKNSGKVARLLMNLMLLRDGFPPVVLHSIERQRYYEVLRAESAGLVPLVLESLDNGVETGMRFFQELEEAKAEARKNRRSSAA
jgi:Fic family protein